MKSILKTAGVFITLVSLISACAQQPGRSSTLKLDPAATNQNPQPSQTQAPASSQPGIDEQWQHAIDMAQARLQQSLQGTALQQAEQNLQHWSETNQAQVDYEKANGTVTKNQAGKLIFIGQSATVFYNLLLDLKYQTEADIKWANF